METNSNNNSQEKDAKSKTDPKDEKDWMSFLNDLIKNPLVTLATGATAGYLFGLNRGKKELEEIKAEYKRQLDERDREMKQFMEKMAHMISGKGISGHRNTEGFKQDDDFGNTYSKRFKLK